MSRGQHDRLTGWAPRGETNRALGNSSTADKLVVTRPSGNPGGRGLRNSANILNDEFSWILVIQDLQSGRSLRAVADVRGCQEDCVAVVGDADTHNLDSRVPQMIEVLNRRFCGNHVLCGFGSIRPLFVWDDDVFRHCWRSGIRWYLGCRYFLQLRRCGRFIISKRWGGHQESADSHRGGSSEG